MKLENKVAVIVGGGNGIGKRTSKLFAQEGARVLVADIGIEAANQVADEIRAMGHDVAAFKVDHTKEEDAFKMVNFALDKFGQIDIMANIAGTHGYIEHGQFIRKDEGPFAESTKELWDSTIDINLNGARNCTRAVINHMMERRKGKIVNFFLHSRHTGSPGLCCLQRCQRRDHQLDQDTGSGVCALRDSYQLHHSRIDCHRTSDGKDGEKPTSWKSAGGYEQIRRSDGGRERGSVAGFG
jgi:hypothetical protein